MRHTIGLDIPLREVNEDYFTLVSLFDLVGIACLPLTGTGNVSAEETYELCRLFA